MKVVFRPPAIGSTVVPLPITGPGTLLLEDDGLHIVGAKVANRGRGAFVMLALILTVAPIVILQTVLDIRGRWTYGIGAAAGGAVLMAMLKKPAKEGEEVRLTVPWANVKKVVWDGVSECIIVVTKKMKPKGGLYIVEAKGSALEAELRSRCG